MNVSLSPELEQFVNEQIKSGHYRTPSEVINDALKNQILDKEKIAFQQRLATSHQQVKDGQIVKAGNEFFLMLSDDN